MDPITDCCILIALIQKEHHPKYLLPGWQKSISNTLQPRFSIISILQDHEDEKEEQFNGNNGVDNSLKVMGLFQTR